MEASAHKMFDINYEHCFLKSRFVDLLCFMAFDNILIVSHPSKLIAKECQLLIIILDNWIDWSGIRGDIVDTITWPSVT